MRGALPLFRFLDDCHARGERTVLVTLTDLLGRSSRAPGAHMAISQSGASMGSFSGGCVEAAVVAEALEVLETGHARLVRFGAGSRYIDIRLPCGGGIDLLFTPDPDRGTVAAITDRLTQRAPALFALEKSGGISLAAGAPEGWQGDRFLCRHDPDPALLIVGHGEETLALVRLALAYPAGVGVLSPDRSIVDHARQIGANAYRLLSPQSTDAVMADPFTAIIFLFHDHDWEADLMMKALSTPAYFIGAMGSRGTHALRCEELRRRGVSKMDVDRIIGPVGLIQAVRDPAMLAVSILAQLVASGGARPDLMVEA